MAHSPGSSQPSGWLIFAIELMHLLLMIWVVIHGSSI
jgi:hypothetical protein